MQRQLSELLVLRAVGGVQLLRRHLVILNRLFHQRVVRRVALLARLVQIVEAIGEEEVCRQRFLGVGIGVDRRLVEIRSLLVILRLVGRVRVLV